MSASMEATDVCTSLRTCTHMASGKRRGEICPKIKIRRDVVVPGRRGEAVEGKRKKNVNMMKRAGEGREGMDYPRNDAITVMDRKGRSDRRSGARTARCRRVIKMAGAGITSIFGDGARSLEQASVGGRLQCWSLMHDMRSRKLLL